MVGYQMLAQGQRGQPLSLARELLELGPLEQALAGEVLALVGYERAAGYRERWTGAAGWWVAACQTLRRLSGAAPEVATAPLRARAGQALGLLCYGPPTTLADAATIPPAPDPRLLDPTEGDAPDQSYWCEIAPGAFWYGNDQGGDLKPVSLPYGFKLARFPVTNAEFAAFIKAGGYENEDWWTPEGWKMKHSRDWQLPRLWHDNRFNAPTQPVVGVSWYEASAYCIWLTKQGHAQDWLPDEDVIRLPTSFEWERAARGPDSRQRYPWGPDEPTPEHANYGATGIGRPAPVGCFPLGRAACGAEDLAGNVYEWMSSPIEQPNKAEEDFTPRSGVLLSWSDFTDGKERLYCGSRDWSLPNDRDIILGFRVIWSRALSK